MENEFNEGLRAMARNVIAEVRRIENKECTLNQMREWLRRCIDNDSKALEQAKDKYYPK